MTKVEYFVDDEKVGESTSAPFGFSYTAVSVGSHTIMIKASDAENNIGTSSLTLNVRLPQSPYGGMAHSIPGVIELEEYDEGGNGFAYADDSPGSSVTPTVNYRTEEDVDVESCSDDGGGYNLGWTTAGEWLEYTVDVAAAGEYDLDLRVASDGAGKTVSISMNGTNIASDVSIPNTTGWQVWETITVKGITLEAGKQIMRLTIGNTDYINLNYVEFKGIVTALHTSLDDVYISPNPFGNEGVRVNSGTNFSYEFSTMDGVVAEEGYAEADEEIGFSLNSGMYLLRLETNDTISIFKVIKK